MKKLILLLLSPILIYSQYSYDPFDWFNQTGSVPVAEAAIIPIGIIDTTIFPPVPYGDLYLYFQPPQTIRYYNIWTMEDLLLGPNTPSFEIGWDMFIVDANQIRANVMGKSFYPTGIENFSVYARYDTLYLQAHDSVWFLLKYNADTSWHTYNLIWDSATTTLSFKFDGSTEFTRVTTFKDTVNNDDDTLQALTFGGSWFRYNADPTEIVAYALFTGGFDNIHVIIRDDTVSKSNFNDGGTTQPQNSEWWYNNIKSQDNHGIWYFDWGSWFGFDNGAWMDYLNPTFQVRSSGLRKDTCKYYSIPEDDITGNRGIQKYSAKADGGYGAFVRADGNKVITNPFDSTEVMVLGGFNIALGDSTDLTTYRSIFLLRNDSAFGLDGGITQLNGYSYNGVWVNDSVFIATHSGDTVGSGLYSPKIAQVNVHTGVWSTLGNVANYPPNSFASQQGLKYFHDTLWIFSDIIELWAYDYANETWIAKDTIKADRPPLPRGAVPDLWQMGEDSLFAVVSGYGVYQLNGGRKTLVCPIPDPYDFDCWYSSSKYDASTGRIWFGGIQYDSGGLVQGLSYYKNGQVVCVANVDSIYNRVPDGYDGGFRPAVFSIAIWQGAVIAAGQFRIVNDRKISNIFQYDDTRGVQVLDYGTDWVDFGMDVYINKDGYRDLIISGDWMSADGVRYNHLAGRYSEEHFAKVKPRFENVVELADSIYKSQYPPASYTYDTYSPSRRAITVVTRFKNGVNVAYTDITATKTDSLLDANLRGYWTYTYSAALTGDTSSVAGGDTIYYYERTTDDYGNVDSTTTKTMRIIADPTEVTSGISYYWSYDTLTVTPVTNWVDNINGLTLTQSTASLKPTLSSGVVFDTLSYLLASSPDTTKLSHNWTLVIVAKITDTNTVDNQFVFGSYTNSGTLLNMLAFKIASVSQSTASKLGVGYNNGAGLTYRTYASNLGSHFNTWSVFIITADSTNKQSLYVNGTQGTNRGAGYSTNEDTPGIALGDMLVVGSWGMKNSIIRIVKVFPRVFDATELTNEYYYQLFNNCN